MKTPQIQYSNKDYQTLLSVLKQKIPYYLSEWTDHNDSDFGIVLLQLFSYVADSRDNPEDTPAAGYPNFFIKPAILT